MLNHTIIMGRLTRDPELRRTGSGIAVTSFTVAVERDYGGKDSEKETDFIDCVAWRQTGEFVAKYFTKGRMIVVDGRLATRSWTDKDGNKRRSVEVVADNCYFGDSKRDSNGAGKGNYNSPQAGGYSAPAGGYAPPAGGYSAPAGGYAPPAGGYSVPAGGYSVPAGGYCAPANNYAPPADAGGYGGSYATGADFGANPMESMDEANVPF